MVLFMDVLQWLYLNYVAQRQKNFELEFQFLNWKPASLLPTYCHLIPFLYVQQSFNLK